MGEDATDHRVIGSLAVAVDGDVRILGRPCLGETTGTGATGNSSRIAWNSTLPPTAFVRPRREVNWFGHAPRVVNRRRRRGPTFRSGLSSSGPASVVERSVTGRPLYSCRSQRVDVGSSMSPTTHCRAGIRNAQEAWDNLELGLPPLDNEGADLCGKRLDCPVGHVGFSSTSGFV